MTNKEILRRAVVGSVITNKQILSALKKRGLIYGYSEYGYLENCQLWYKFNYGNEIMSDWVIGCIFPNGNSPKEYSLEYENRESIKNIYGYMYEIEYMGCKFRTKYLDGCFNPYLQLVEKNGDKEMKTNPRMSLYGQVI